MGQLVAKLGVMFNFIIRRVPPLELTRTKMVFLVRTDLQMGKGKVASQVAHAALQLYKQATKRRHPYLNMWLTMGQPKVVLKVDKNCEEELNIVYSDALDQGLNACKVFDAGRTQIECGSLTVVGIGPEKAKIIDEITGKFKLL